MVWTTRSPGTPSPPPPREKQKPGAGELKQSPQPQLQGPGSSDLWPPIDHHSRGAGTCPGRMADGARRGQKRVTSSLGPLSGVTRTALAPRQQRNSASVRETTPQGAPPTWGPHRHLARLGPAHFPTREPTGPVCAHPASAPPRDAPSRCGPVAAE